MLSGLSACMTSSHPTWQHLPPRTIGGKTFRQYATVNRIDGTVRETFVDEATLGRWRPGQALPANTLILMQVISATSAATGGLSTSFTKRMDADGYFRYGQFEPTQPNFSTAPNRECEACHIVSADTAGTFTMPLLNAAITRGQPLRIVCDRPGRLPCEDEMYEAESDEP